MFHIETSSSDATDKKEEVTVREKLKRTQMPAFPELFLDFNYYTDGYE